MSGAPANAEIIHNTNITYITPIAAISFFIVLLAISIFVAWLEARKHSTSTREELIGICSFVLDQGGRKNRNKEKTIAFLAEKGELNNAIIREALGVSRRSVARYMTELEQEKKVEQIGDIGRGV